MAPTVGDGAYRKRSLVEYDTWYVILVTSISTCLLNFCSAFDKQKAGQYCINGIESYLSSFGLFFTWLN